MVHDTHTRRRRRRIAYSYSLASYVGSAGDLQAVTLGNLMIIFDDDTYIIIPAASGNSRQSEIGNVELWSWANNLKVNPAKYAEIIFADKRRKDAVQLPLLASQP